MRRLAAAVDSRSSRGTRRPSTSLVARSLEPWNPLRLLLVYAKAIKSQSASAKDYPLKVEDFDGACDTAAFGVVRPVKSAAPLCCFRGCLKHPRIQSTTATSCCRTIRNSAAALSRRSGPTLRSTDVAALAKASASFCLRKLAAPFPAPKMLSLPALLMGALVFCLGPVDASAIKRADNANDYPLKVKFRHGTSEYPMTLTLLDFFYFSIRLLVICVEAQLPSRLYLPRLLSRPSGRPHVQGAEHEDRRGADKDIEKSAPCPRVKAFWYNHTEIIFFKVSTCEKQENCDNSVTYWIEKSKGKSE
ncbi:hypothetical protein L596_022663 [Steinernema carpocapsae]|uniref:Uncharacterized protein n=1 Tax=Steinernema carpocapsae TaxID=34508 RepID=A0A4U5MMF1_STECR|nr:hypothetical protein L596_022663 [Steinernema carpocapsae]